MKRFLAIGAFALIGSLAFTANANAQYAYGYNSYNPYTGSIGTTTGVYLPFAAQTNYSYYNPYTGATGQRTLYQNVYGISVYQAYGGNPYLGRGYATGYYNPGFGVSPLYGSYYRYRYR